MKFFTKLFYKDILVSIYKDDDGEFYMIGEDIGRCLEFSKPRVQMFNYFTSHFNIKDPIYAKQARLSSRKGQLTWCYTGLAVKEVAKYRENIALKEWADSVFLQLQQGYYEADSDYVKPLQMEITKESETERRRKTALSKQIYTDNQKRAKFLIEYAKLCHDSNEIERLKSAAMALFRGAPLSEVQEKYLKSYGKFYVD